MRNLSTSEAQAVGGSLSLGLVLDPVVVVYDPFYYDTYYYTPYYYDSYVVVYDDYYYGGYGYDYCYDCYYYY